MANYLDAFARFGGGPSLLERVEHNRGNRLQNDRIGLLNAQTSSEMSRLNTLRDLYGQFVGGDQGALNKIASVDPGFHQQVQAGLMQMDKAQRDALREQMAGTARKAQIASRDPNLWSQVFPNIPYEKAGQVVAEGAVFEDVYKSIIDQEQAAFKAAQPPESVRKLQYLMQNPDAMAAEQALRRSGSTTINNLPKPDFGYVYNDPSDPSKGVSIVPGSKADLDLRKEQEAKANKLRTIVSSASNTIDEIDKAVGLAGGFAATGIPGAASGGVPQTPAYKLRAVIGTIKANIGFDRLQAMRDASPTGGALGQVAIQELNALQNSIASLDPNLGEDELVKNLNKVRTHYSNWLSAVSGSTESAQNQADTQASPVRRYNPQTGMIE